MPCYATVRVICSRAKKKYSRAAMETDTTVDAPASPDPKFVFTAYASCGILMVVMLSWSAFALTKLKPFQDSVNGSFGSTNNAPGNLTSELRPVLPRALESLPESWNKGASFDLYPEDYYLNNSHKYFCFYQATAELLVASGIRYDLSVFPYHLCTHVVFCCARANATTFQIEPPDEAQDFALYIQSRNPYLRPLLSISGKLNTFLLDNSWVFLESSIIWLQSRHYSGVVLSWTHSLLTMDVRKKYGDFLEAVSRRYNKESLSLSVVIDPSESASSGFDVGELDYLLSANYSILIYPIVSDAPIVRSEKIEEQSAVVYDRERVLRSLKTLQSAVQRYHLHDGTGIYKLCYILSFAGSTYKFWDRNATGVEEIVLGPGDAGPSTRTPGSLAYHEICNQMWDSSTVFEYGVVSQQVDTLVSHVSEFVVPALARFLHDVLDARCFGVWNLWFDDFAGSCGMGPYPLMRSLFGLFGDQ